MKSWARIRAAIAVGVVAVCVLVCWKTWEHAAPNGPAAEVEAVRADSATAITAIGPTDGLPEVLKRALNPGGDFDLIPKPKPGDWLAEHPEPGQTFDGFVKSERNAPDQIRGKIYLQPLGAFPPGQSPSLESLQRFAAAYFGLPVEVLAAVDLDAGSITGRVNSYTHKRQILTGDVLDMLTKRLPADAFCLLALTMTDLYPEASWNFVFGQASLQDRVGVFSLARYDPRFYGEDRGSDYDALLLRRSCRVLAHETAHMFGLWHCVYFRCVMNGSNHLAESDSRPLRLCPVCLRKLQNSVGFDVVERYRKLRSFYEQAGLRDEAQWARRRIETISGAAAPKESTGP